MKDLTNEDNIWEAACLAMREVYNRLNLAPYPASGECECGNKSFVYNEFGHTMTCSTELSPGHLTVKTGGWDDMTAEGEFSLLCCGACGKAFDLPEDVREISWN